MTLSVILSIILLNCCDGVFEWILLLNALPLPRIMAVLLIETKKAAQHGISRAMLYKLCKEDKIHRVVKGQYILPDDMEDER